MRKSYLIASALVLAITGWMLAGYIVGGVKSEDSLGKQSSTDAPDRMMVEIDTHHAELVARRLVSQGQVEPNRAVTVRAETLGRVAEVVAREGQPVRVDDVLVRLEMNDRQARLKRAEALLAEQQKAHERAKQLDEKGYQAQRLIDESYSALQAAQANMAEIQLEIRNTVIRAPFDGVLEIRQVNIGDYVDVNGEVATIVDNDPLVVTVQIAQQDIGMITLGSVADVAFATGQRSEGVIRFIASRANDTTRTFRVEIEVRNPNRLIPSGTSAEVSIPTGSVLAHFVSPALLTLNDIGQVGIKSVNDDDIVEFHPVTIVLSETGGVWVSGLPDTARVITVGSGFVRAGEIVQGVSAQSDRTPSGVTQATTMLSPATQDEMERSQ